MIIKLANPRGSPVHKRSRYPLVIQKARKEDIPQIVEQSDENITHVPRPVGQQSGRKKNPVRIIE